MAVKPKTVLWKTIFSKDEEPAIGLESNLPIHQQYRRAPGGVNLGLIYFPSAFPTTSPKTRECRGHTFPLPFSLHPIHNKTCLGKVKCSICMSWNLREAENENNLDLWTLSEVVFFPWKVNEVWSRVTRLHDCLMLGKPFWQPYQLLTAAVRTLVHRAR